MCHRRATLEAQLAPQPSTERGRPARLHATSAAPARVAYGAGKVAVLRELDDPTKVGHSKGGGGR